MEVETTRFGVINIEEEKVIHFPRGIPGFEELRRFFILPAGAAEKFQWLQSLEEPAVALLVIDPFQFFQGYYVDIPESDLKELEINNPSETLVISVVSVPPKEPSAATANLLAPIIINTPLNKAVQVILNGSPYTTKHRLIQSADTSGGEG